jgi:hypothetical protein
MAGFKSFIIGIVICFLVPLFLITFSEKFLQATNPTSPLLTDDEYNLSKAANPIRSGINQYQDIAKYNINALQNATMNPVEFVFLFASEMFTVPIGFLKFLAGGISSMGNLLFDIATENTFGEAFTISITILFTSLGVIATLYIIKLIRMGESER